MWRYTATDGAVANSAASARSLSRPQQRVERGAEFGVPRVGVAAGGGGQARLGQPVQARGFVGRGG